MVGLNLFKIEIVLKLGQVPTPLFFELLDVEYRFRRLELHMSSFMVGGIGLRLARGQRSESAHPSLFKDRLGRPEYEI